jgi:hypothetical protein
LIIKKRETPKTVCFLWRPFLEVPLQHFHQMKPSLHYPYCMHTFTLGASPMLKPLATQGTPPHIHPRASCVIGWWDEAVGCWGMGLSNTPPPSPPPFPPPNACPSKGAGGVDTAVGSADPAVAARDNNLSKPASESTLSNNLSMPASGFTLSPQSRARSRSRSEQRA